MAKDSATQGTYDGSRDGIVSELGCYLHVRPGHADDLRRELHAFATSPGRKGMVSAATKIGVRTLRGTLFDNDTRFVFATTFDTDWDTYVDDAVEMMGGIAPWGKFLQHCEEIPENAGTPGAVNNADAKAMLASVRTKAADYIDTYPEVSCKEFNRALDVLAAFEKVLDNPAAAEALKNPALKPLLDQASTG
jgi:hypothetical protein